MGRKVVAADDVVGLEFRFLVRQIAERRSESLNSVFTTAEQWGNFSTSWVKDRYYGRTKVLLSDCDRLRVLITSSTILPRMVSELSKHREAVARMCAECAGSGGLCWDAGCPLRPVSPLKVSGR